MKKFLFKQTPINGRLLIGILGAVLIHGGLWFSSFFLSSRPQYEVIVSPSVLEVALVKSVPREKKVLESPPEVIEDPLPVKEFEKTIEPDIVLPEPEPEPEAKELELKTLEPDPEPAEESPQEIDSDINEETEPFEENREDVHSEDINMLQGVMMDAVPLKYKNQPPRYPRKARQRGWEGRVVLNVEVRENGSAGRVYILQSSGYDILDEAATQALSRWQFEPAFRFGRPASSEIEIPVVFRLE